MAETYRGRDISAPQSRNPEAWRGQTDKSWGAQKPVELTLLQDNEITRRAHFDSGIDAARALFPTLSKEKQDRPFSHGTSSVVIGSIEEPTDARYAKPGEFPTSDTVSRRVDTVAEKREAARQIGLPSYPRRAKKERNQRNRGRGSKN